MDQRNKQVVLGDLPGDFLRFDAAIPSTATNNDAPPTTSSPSKQPPSQLELDELAARSLHQELNPQAPVALATTGYYAGGTGFVPANTKGRLSICLVQARLSKNYGFGFVKMDPYCRVRVGNTVFETPTDAGGGKTPHWNRTVYCYLPQGIDSIYLEIFDEKAFSTDERIAWNRITIPEAVFNGDTIDDWYTLSGQQGDAKEGMINLVFTLYPVNAPHVAYVPVSQPAPQPIVLTGGSVPASAVPYAHAPIVAAPMQQAQPAPPQVPPGPPQAQLGPPQAQLGPPQAQPAVFACDENDVTELQEMFCNMDVEAIRSVLYEKRGNKESSINALLILAADIDVTPTVTPTSKAAAKNLESEGQKENGLVHDK